VPSDQAKIGQEGLAKAFKAALTEAILKNHVTDESLRVQKVGYIQKRIPQYPAAIREIAAPLYRMPRRSRYHHSIAFYLPHGVQAMVKGCTSMGTSDRPPHPLSIAVLLADDQRQWSVPFLLSWPSRHC
jgi:hypothetical protein